MSVGGLEHNERSTRDEKGVYLKQDTKTLSDTFRRGIYTYTLYIDYGVLTAESLLQASELHGCSVGWESNVVQVSWRKKAKKDETDWKREQTVEHHLLTVLNHPSSTKAYGLLTASFHPESRSTELCHIKWQYIVSQSGKSYILEKVWLKQR